MKKLFVVFVVGVLVAGMALFVGCSDEDSGGGLFDGVLGGKSKLEKAYEDVLASYPEAASCFELAEDGSFISADTNPYNIDDYVDLDAIDAMEKLNDLLDLPDYIWQSMLETSALDGRQTETANGITVSWKYHPDNGLEAIYREA